MIKKEDVFIPNHVGIIVSGSKRWSKERNLPIEVGYEKSCYKIRQVPQWFFDKKVKVVSVFMFSYRHWETKDQEELNFLMKLLKTFFRDDFEDLQNKGYKIVMSGKIDELPGDLPEICREAASLTKNNESGVLNFCINYGGREEILDAVRKIVLNKIDLEQIHEGIFKKYIYNDGLGDPDLLIKTSGDKCLSGFLLWGSEQSELSFLKNLWPDLEKADVLKALDDYNKNKQRTE